MAKEKERQRLIKREERLLARLEQEKAAAAAAVAQIQQFQLMSVEGSTPGSQSELRLDASSWSYNMKSAALDAARVAGLFAEVYGTPPEQVI